jgi:glycosyltransferase involved in cell wall biosynthesis
MSAHVLFVPAWYATAEDPTNGRYFQQQALAVLRAGGRVGLVFPELRSLRRLDWAALREHRFQVERSDEAGLATWRLRAWNVMPGFAIARARLWTWAAFLLGARYGRTVGRPSIVHGHGTLFGGIAAIALARHFDVPCVITEHWSGFMTGELPAWQRSAARRALRCADRVLAVSEALRGAMEQGGLVSQGTMELMPNVVDEEAFGLPPRSRPSECFRFVAVGRLVRGKAIDRLLRVFAAGFPRNPRVGLDIVGDGPERLRLEELARQLGLAERVRFRGGLAHREVRDALWRAHALVHPSDVETFGVVAIEAMATGIPVVAFAHGALAEVVDPRTGILVPPGDEPALSAAMQSLVAGQRAFDGPAVRRHAVERFGSQAVGARLMRLYASLSSQFREVRNSRDLCSRREAPPSR